MTVQARELYCVIAGLIGAALLLVYAALSIWAERKAGAPRSESPGEKWCRGLGADLGSAGALLAVLALGLWLARTVQASGRGMALAFLVGSVLALALRALDAWAGARLGEADPQQVCGRSAGLGALPVGAALGAAAAINLWQATNMGAVLFGLFAPAVVVALLAALVRKEAPLTRTLALFGALLAGCMALGAYRMQWDRLGLLLPLLPAALAVPVYIVLSHVRGRVHAGHACRVPILVQVPAAALLGWIGADSVRLLLEKQAGALPLTWALGVAVGVVLWWLVEFLSPGGAGRRAAPEMLVGVVVLLALGLVVAYGKATGFGVGLFGLGAFAWLGLAAEADLAGARLGASAQAEASPSGDRLLAVARLEQLGAALVTAYLLVRCAAERHDWAEVTFDPRTAWPFLGVILGLLISLVITSLADRGSARSPRPWVQAGHAVWLVVALLGLTALMAFFWREGTVAGLMGGLVLAALVALLAQWSDLKVPLVPGALGALLCGLMALHFAPAIHEATGGEGRVARIILLLGAAAVAAVVSALLGALSGASTSAEVRLRACSACGEEAKPEVTRDAEG